MKKLNSIIWGVVLIIAGALFALNALNITDINVFFDGWWTLLIIVPCTVGLFTEQDKTGNLIGIVIGVLLLLCCRDILSFSILWKLLVPVIIVIIGLKLVLRGIFDNKTNAIIKKINAEGKNLKQICAVFSGSNINYTNEIFEGAELTAVFGGIDCNLKNAIIDKDCVIRVNAIFGGIDIIVPDNVNVKANTTSIFGGTSNKTVSRKDAPTVYINGVCMFGGVEIK